MFCQKPAVLKALADGGILTARKVGRSKYFGNDSLCAILTGDALTTTK